MVPDENSAIGTLVNSCTSSSFSMADEDEEDKEEVEAEAEPLDDDTNDGDVERLLDKSLLLLLSELLGLQVNVRARPSPSLTRNEYRDDRGLSRVKCSQLIRCELLGSPRPMMASDEKCRYLQTPAMGPLSDP